MVSPDEIIVSASPGETRFAVMAGGLPVEFHVDRGGAAVGDIIFGRVLTVNHALDAAFIDIGETVPGFLPHPEGVGEGEALLVQAVAAAQGGKGAGLTRAVSLQGAVLAYTPARPGLNLSRRMADAERRSAIRRLLGPLVTGDEGLVVRTAAEGAADSLLLDELAVLRQRWCRIETAVAKATAPARVETVSPLVRLLADFPGVRRLRVDDRASLAAVRAVFPDAVYEDRCFDVEVGEAFEQALERHVALPGGGRLTIEQTAAVTAIDVDSGGGSPLAANLAAIPVIARELRLRGLAGHILIDAIPVKDRRALTSLVTALRKAVADDPTPTRVIGVTPLGLIEMTRDRRQPGLADVMLENLGPQPTAETIALQGLRAALRQADAGRPGAALRLSARPAVIASIRARPRLLAEMTDRLGRPLTLAEAPQIALFEISEEQP
ncbi:ribonuclease E/G [Telmatospirillum sp.]|uniref:ribonuclease E/G n=1 Tax=Telmatospirillum sp. TaxID=2079197 RepID=UPI002848FF3C|nr:ribonuclease E/G [Telmatospirillum sp.]MDR3439902.1 ribonuclease E/G [Telmatospirillum sp.]